MRVSLPDVCKEIFAGGDVPKGRFSKEKTDCFKVPVFANAEQDDGLYGYTDKARVFEESVTVAARGTIGYTSIRREPFLPVVRLITVIPDKEKVDLDYLYYALRNHRSASSGTSIPQLTVPEIKKYSFNLIVDRKRQKEVVLLLSCVEEVIEKQKKEILLLDELIKARFVEMFGDPEKGNKYPRIAIQDFAEVISGGTPNRKNSDYWEGGAIPWIKTTELQNSVITSAEEYITEKGLSESSAKIVPQNTVLIALYGQGKTRGMTGFLGIEATTNQACACILPSRSVEPKYLWQYMVLSYERLRNLGQGGNQPNLSGKMIKDFTIIMPPMDLQKKYVEFVECVNKTKVAVQKSLDEAQLLFDSLMQKYFGRGEK